MVKPVSISRIATEGCPLVVVTGPDGAGKSTAVRAVGDRLENVWGPGTVARPSIWDSMLRSGQFSKEAVVAYLGSLGGSARALFLFHAMRRSLDLALETEPRLVLVDSYFYKYAAAELAYGTPPEVIRGAALAFPRPLRVVYLEVDPRTARARKSEMSRYESGGSDFERFQEAMAEGWRAIEAEHGPWERLDSAAGPDCVADGILAILRRDGICE